MGGENYNPNSLDASISRIETVLNRHVEETVVFRKRLEETLASHEKEIAQLKSDKARTIGFAAGAGAAGGGLGAFLHKIFGA